MNGPLHPCAIGGSSSRGAVLGDRLTRLWNCEIGGVCESRAPVKGKNSLKLHTKFKMADFLLGLGEAFCKTGHVCAYQILYWNVPQGLLCWSFVGGAMEPYCHTQAQEPYQINTSLSPLLMFVPNVMSFTASLALQKRLPFSQDIQTVCLASETVFYENSKALQLQ